jgi:hypothetical protein
MIRGEAAAILQLSVLLSQVALQRPNFYLELYKFDGIFSLKAQFLRAQVRLA